MQNSMMMYEVFISHHTQKYKEARNRMVNDEIANVEDIRDKDLREMVLAKKMTFEDAKNIINMRMAYHDIGLHTF